LHAWDARYAVVHAIADRVAERESIELSLRRTFGVAGSVSSTVSGPVSCSVGTGANAGGPLTSAVSIEKDGRQGGPQRRERQPLHAEPGKTPARRRSARRVK